MPPWNMLRFAAANSRMVSAALTLRSEPYHRRQTAQFR